MLSPKPAVPTPAGHFSGADPSVCQQCRGTLLSKLSASNQGAGQLADIPGQGYDPYTYKKMITAFLPVGVLILWRSLPTRIFTGLSVFQRPPHKHIYRSLRVPKASGCITCRPGLTTLNRR